MIWAAISINGWPIVGIRIIRVHLWMDRRGLITTACRMSCARDPGRTIRVMFDPLAVISTIPAYAIRRTASGLHTHYKEEAAYEKCASNLNNCRAERATDRGVLSRKTSTRRRLSLYYLASGWCHAQRCVLVSVRSPQHGRHPGGQQRS